MRPPRWIQLGKPYIGKDGLARIDMIVNWRSWGPYREILHCPELTRWQRLAVYWLWLKTQFGLWPRRDEHDA